MAKDRVLWRSISMRILCPYRGKILTLIMGLETGKYYALLNVVEDNILSAKKWRSNNNFFPTKCMDTMTKELKFTLGIP